MCSRSRNEIGALFTCCAALACPSFLSCPIEALLARRMNGTPRRPRTSDRSRLKIYTGRGSPETLTLATTLPPSRCMDLCASFATCACLSAVPFRRAARSCPVDGGPALRYFGVACYVAHCARRLAELPRRVQKRCKLRSRLARIPHTEII